jgi:hypothetical protein
MESRYRLEGEKPVLVQARGRDPSLGFLVTNKFSLDKS